CTRAIGCAVPPGPGAGVGGATAGGPPARRPRASSSAAAGRAPESRDSVTYGSMSPGDTVLPERSITCASAGTATEPETPTASMTPPRTTTVPFSSTLPGAVITRAFVSAYTFERSAPFIAGPKRTKRMPRPHFTRIADSPLLEQVILDELQRCEELEILVLFLAEPVGLVLREEVPDGAAVLLDRRHHLLRLRVRHARVVAALDDEHGLRDLAGVRERRDREEQLAHPWIALIAVLGAAQVPPVGLRVPEERHPARDPAAVDGAPEAVFVVRHGGGRHVPAVGTARHHDAALVQQGLDSDPVEKRADVLHGILALLGVVEGEERLAEARRPAH